MPALRHVPLIAMSGYGQSQNRETSLAAGFAEHLVKPVAIEVLIHAVEVQLKT